MTKLSKVLAKKGYWIEASGKVASILRKLNTPYVDDEETLKKIFVDSTFEFTNDGRYIRTLGGGKKTDEEALFGSPKL